jgi:integrase
VAPPAWGSWSVARLAAERQVFGDARGMSWKAVAAELGMAESTAIHLYRVQLDSHEADDALGRVDRALYLTAAMTGMRQGELFALRWMDVDWPSHRFRVRQLRPRHVRHAQVQALVTEHPARRPGRARARAALPDLGVPRGRRPRIRAPTPAGR